MSALRPTTLPDPALRPLMTPTTPVLPMPGTTSSQPKARNLSATMPAVRCTSKPISGCSWMSRRQAVISSCRSATRLTIGMSVPLQLPVFAGRSLSRSRRNGSAKARSRTIACRGPGHDRPRKRAHLGFDLGSAGMCNPPQAGVGAKLQRALPFTNLRQVESKMGHSRRSMLGIAAALAAAIAVGAPAPASAQKTLRAVMHSDLKILDPIWTTAYIVRNHGYMVYDTLFATDANGADQAADGRQARGVGRQAHLHLHPARRPRLARRPARHGRGLRRLDQALGRQGLDGPEADDVRRRPRGRRTPRPSP